MIIVYPNEFSLGSIEFAPWYEQFKDSNCVRCIENQEDCPKNTWEDIDNEYIKSMLKD